MTPKLNECCCDDRQCLTRLTSALPAALSNTPPREAHVGHLKATYFTDGTLQGRILNVLSH
jgi:hypothetical protein